MATRTPEGVPLAGNGDVKKTKRLARRVKLSAAITHLVKFLHFVTLPYTIHVMVKAKKCRVCRKSFEAQRKTARYCSAACRQRAHRLRKEA